MADEAVDDRADLAAGVSIAGLTDGGVIRGRVNDEDVLLARASGELFAVGASCTHYHGALADGLIVGDTIRCPLHHACFSLRTGDALRAPALDPIACWRVEREGDRAFVREKQPPPTPPGSLTSTQVLPSSIVIVGGGAAGLAAADTLRREGFGGLVTMISADDAPPVDRPNLSKDYLAGQAADDWIPLRSPEYYARQRIDVVLNARVVSIDVRARQVWLESGAQHPFDALLLATGAEPVRLPVPGAESGQVFYLRSFKDAARSSRRPRVRRASWWSARASSVSKCRRHCVPGASRSMSWRRRPFRWKRSWAPTSDASSRPFTRHTA